MSASRDGNGTFNRAYDWTDDAANSIPITASKFDVEMDGLASEITNSVAKDGQSTMSGNLKMGGFKVTGMANGTLSGDAVTLSQIQTLLAKVTTVELGGTGLATLTANYLMAGNGTSAVNLIAPGTAGNILTSTGTAFVSAAPASRINQGTTVATTSGTSIDFTSLPSGVKRITLMFNGVSTNGTSYLQLQLGSGSIVTTGYLGTSTIGSSLATNNTNGWNISTNQVSTNNYYGSIVINNMTSNIWVENGCISGISYLSSVSNGVISLAGTLDRLRITTVNGTDTFDAGSINISYEL